MYTIDEKYLTIIIVNNNHSQQERNIVNILNNTMPKVVPEETRWVILGTYWKGKYSLKAIWW